MNWRISSHSMTGQTCVAVNIVPELETVYVRDTKDGESEILDLHTSSWAAFLEWVR